ncbi:MotA/TolQ/ExbB proton channel family protein [Acidocella sp. KAb 2-4]|uniref:MotA/TolQ/ExbB proton channel family protein n=1 Tax=Acidocella sp. KAb 2-4 TaxID=2885158 RepID=UPI001D06E0FB|nr:MotA/TolQ/ExbB proton channel family protein [Acidocella sp. KAb 2-4]MCB5944636.1 MotA/TolQ/ExbB proton channel family protein [Acidocella sp. KAb 2-4]
MTLSYIVYLANYSDGVLYILAALLLVALAVILDRFWSLRRTIVFGQSVIRATAELSTLRQGELAALRDTAGKLPEAALLDTAARHLGADAATIAGHLDEAIMLIAPSLDRRLWVLDTVVTLAPLLGLFGTIIGMFHAFNVLAQPGHAPAEVTGGVADALVATAFGLFIAMLGLTGFNALSNQVRLIVHQLDSLKTMIVNRLGTTPVAAVSHAAAPHSAPAYATV